MPLEHVEEPARQIPVSHHADVVVAGGGTAGVAAAVVAARLGLQVVMVERTALPGGMVTQLSWLNDFKNKGGFPREFLQNLEDQGIYTAPNYNPFLVVPYFDRLLREARVQTLYLAFVAAPLIENGSVAGVIIESKSGRTAIRAKLVIDATGDADVAAMAGAEFKIGRDSDGACQAISLVHLLTNYRAGKITRERMCELAEAAAKSAGNGFKLPYDKWSPKPIVGTESCLANGLPHATGWNPLSVDEMSKCLIELRQQAWNIYSTLKKHTAEFASIEFGPFVGLPGIRESRRIIGDVEITRDCVVKGGRFPDGLFMVQQNIDIHKCTQDEPAIIVLPVQPYNLPYRALLPKGIENLLVAGRCISGAHEAEASYRVIADCMGMGEAAAIAAKMAIDNHCSPRQIAVKELVNEMRKRGYAH